MVTDSPVGGPCQGEWTEQAAYIPGEFLFMLVDIKAVRSEKAGMQERSRALNSDRVLKNYSWKKKKKRTTAGRREAIGPLEQETEQMIHYSQAPAVSSLCTVGGGEWGRGCVLESGDP